MRPREYNEKIMKSGISMSRSVLIMATLLRTMRFSYMRSRCYYLDVSTLFYEGV